MLAKAIINGWISKSRPLKEMPIYKRPLKEMPLYERPTKKASSFQKFMAGLVSRPDLS